MGFLSKCFLFSVAFLHAAYLFAFRRKAMLAHDGFSGSRPHLSLAAFVLLCFLASCVEKDDEMTCYDIGLAPGVKNVKPSPSSFLAALAVAWRSLDMKNVHEFEKQVDKAVEDKAFSKDAAGYLKLAYNELAYHMASKIPGITCYDMSMQGVYAMRSRDALEGQLAAIDAAKAAGRLDAAVAEKFAKAIARDLEILKQLGTQAASDRYDPKTQEATSASIEAAGVIVELQAASSSKCEDKREKVQK